MLDFTLKVVVFILLASTPICRTLVAAAAVVRQRERVCVYCNGDANVPNNGASRLSCKSQYSNALVCKWGDKSFNLPDCAKYKLQGVDITCGKAYACPKTLQTKDNTIFYLRATLKDLSSESGRCPDPNTIVTECGTTNVKCIGSAASGNGNGTPKPTQTPSPGEFLQKIN